MIINIKSYEYKRIEKDSTPIEIPEETVYLFQTGIRRAIRIVPEYTTWNKEEYGKEEEIYSLKITCVYNSFEAKVETYNIALTELETMINNNKNNNHDTYNIALLLLHKDFNIRTKEQFEKDLNTVLNQL